MKDQQPNPFSKAPSSGGASSVYKEADKATLAFLADKLSEGALVAIPTETVYGLAADALNESACQKIFEVKGRPLLDPLICHIHDFTQLEELAEFDETTLKLAKQFWPGPLTLVLKKKPIVSDLVTAGLPTMAVRMPAHPVARQLLKAVKRPLAAPSANPFGYVSPTTADHVVESLGNKVEYILDGGPCEIGIESTILDLSEPTSPCLLRPGAIGREELEEVLGQSIALPAKKASITAPGMLDQHYSPKTPLSLFEDSPSSKLTTNMAVVYITREASDAHPSPAQHYWMTEDGDLKKVAHDLFALLRRLDQGSFDHIHLQSPKEEGLGVAINDRLRRAAAKRT